MITVSRQDYSVVDANPTITKTQTSGISYFYEALLTTNNVFSVVFGDESDSNGIIFHPIKASLCKVTGLSASGGTAIITVEWKEIVNIYQNSVLDIPKFIRQCSIETSGIDGDNLASFSLQILYRRADVSSKKQIIHAV